MVYHSLPHYPTSKAWESHNFSCQAVTCQSGNLPNLRTANEGKFHGETTSLPQQLIWVWPAYLSCSNLGISQNLVIQNLTDAAASGLPDARCARPSEWHRSDAPCAAGHWTAWQSWFGCDIFLVVTPTWVLNLSARMSRVFLHHLHIMYNLTHVFFKGHSLRSDWLRRPQCVCPVRRPAQAVPFELTQPKWSSSLSLSFCSEPRTYHFMVRVPSEKEPNVILKYSA
jgi:hypothetical protein